MLVSVEPTRGGVWRDERNGDSVSREYDPYRPWLLIPSDKSHFLHEKAFTPLQGEGFFNRMVTYAEWRDFYLAISLASKEENPVLSYSSATKNYLMVKGEK